MRDIAGAPNFQHLPPRERLRRHATNKLADRFGWRPTRAEYEELCERARSGRESVDPENSFVSSRQVQLWVLRGQRVRVVYDLEEDAVVTVFSGWQDDRLVGPRPRGARRRSRPRY